MVSSRPTCATSWSAGCVEVVGVEFPTWCPIPPTDCQATCDVAGPDGTVCFWEGCDDGNFVDTDGCTNACELAVCGDGIVWAGVEECDDGNSNDGDGCTNACTLAVCGDGAVRLGVEECDDGNMDNNDACLNSCVAAACLDGVHRNDPGSPEQCDDGNPINTDACLPDCTAASCGDGIVWEGEEECDLGAANSDVLPNVCRLNCSLPYCGDGVVDSVNLETCDPGSSDVLSVCCVNCKFSPGSCSSCSNASYALVGSCVSGTCDASVPVSCAPYVCDSVESGCLTRCATDSQCLPGFVCSGDSVCVAPTSSVGAGFVNLQDSQLSSSVSGLWAFLTFVLIFSVVAAFVIAALKFRASRSARAKGYAIQRGGDGGKGGVVELDDFVGSAATMSSTATTARSARSARSATTTTTTTSSSRLSSSSSVSVSVSASASASAAASPSPSSSSLSSSSSSSIV